MKVLAVVSAVGLCLLAPLSLLFTSGGSPPGACRLPVQGDAVLAAIRSIESGGDYEAEAPGSTASGAYQFIDATWAGYGGYPRASDAPPAVQDRKAAESVAAILDQHDGDVSAVPVVWYLGYLPPEGDPAWDEVPGSNRHTPREYQQRWLDTYEALIAEGTETAAEGQTCTENMPMLADGFARARTRRPVQSRSGRPTPPRLPGVGLGCPGQDAHLRRARRHRHSGPHLVRQLVRRRMPERRFRVRRLRCRGHRPRRRRHHLDLLPRLRARPSRWALRSRPAPSS